MRSEIRIYETQEVDHGVFEVTSYKVVKRETEIAHFQSGKVTDAEFELELPQRRLTGRRVIIVISALGAAVAIGYAILNDDNPDKLQDGRAGVEELGR